MIVLAFNVLQLTSMVGSILSCFPSTISLNGVPAMVKSKVDNVEILADVAVKWSPIEAFPNVVSVLGRTLRLVENRKSKILRKSRPISQNSHFHSANDFGYGFSPRRF